MRVNVIFTCYNRKEKTQKCIEKLIFGNPNLEFTFIIVDDGSTDGTQDMLQQMKKTYDIHIIQGTGKLFYSGGMRIGMQYVLDNLEKNFEYVILINDDVEFTENSIERIIKQSKYQNDAVIVGVLKDYSGNMSYSAIKYTSGINYKKLTTIDWKTQADTFNANCVLLPSLVFATIGTIDSHYIHSLGDFDYGLDLKRHGFRIYPSSEYVGICNSNTDRNTWIDNTLSRKKRIQKKESIKGAPTKQWFYFLKKNFGIAVAIKGCITPYLRILLRK